MGAISTTEGYIRGKERNKRKIRKNKRKLKTKKDIEREKKDFWQASHSSDAFYVRSCSLIMELVKDTRNIEAYLQ